MKYVSLDIETGGLTSEYSLLEVGAVIEDTENADAPVEELPKFHGYLKPDPIVVNPFVAQMHKRIWDLFNSPSINMMVAPEWFQSPNGEAEKCDALADAGILFPNWPAMRFQFRNWLDFYEVPRPVNIAGKNVHWDMDFLDAQERPFRQYVGTSSRVVDPAILYGKPDDQNLPNLTECMKRAGMGLTDLHSAVGDAIDVVRLLRNEGSLYA